MPTPAVFPLALVALIFSELLVIPTAVMAEVPVPVNVRLLISKFWPSVVVAKLLAVLAVKNTLVIGPGAANVSAPAGPSSQLLLLVLPLANAFQAVPSVPLQYAFAGTAAPADSVSCRVVSVLVRPRV